MISTLFNVLFSHTLRQSGRRNSLCKLNLALDDILLALIPLQGNIMKRSTISLKLMVTVVTVFFHRWSLNLYAKISLKSTFLFITVLDKCTLVVCADLCVSV